MLNHKGTFICEPTPQALQLWNHVKEGCEWIIWSPKPCKTKRFFFLSSRGHPIAYYSLKCFWKAPKYWWIDETLSLWYFWSCRKIETSRSLANLTKIFCKENHTSANVFKSITWARTSSKSITMTYPGKRRSNLLHCKNSVTSSKALASFAKLEKMAIVRLGIWYSPSMNPTKYWLSISESIWTQHLVLTINDMDT